MRPGPGLVVMALAFISGARRGSTSTSTSQQKISSLTSSSSSSFLSSSSDSSSLSLSSSSKSPLLLLPSNEYHYYQQQQHQLPPEQRTRSNRHPSFSISSSPYSSSSKSSSTSSLPDASSPALSSSYSLFHSLRSPDSSPVASQLYPSSLSLSSSLSSDYRNSFTIYNHDRSNGDTEHNYHFDNFKLDKISYVNVEDYGENIEEVSTVIGRGGGSGHSVGEDRAEDDDRGSGFFFSGVHSHSHIFESTSSLSRVNPWLSACDLAQPSSAPDLQGQCTAGSLPVAWVDEGPGPPTCPKSCEQLRLENKYNSNFNSNKNKIHNYDNNNLINLNNNNNFNPVHNIMSKVRREIAGLHASSSASGSAAPRSTTTAPSNAAAAKNGHSYDSPQISTIKPPGVVERTTTTVSTASINANKMVADKTVETKFEQKQHQQHHQMQRNIQSDMQSLPQDYQYNYNNLNNYNVVKNNLNNNYNQNNNVNNNKLNDNSNQYNQNQQQQQCLDYLGDNDDSSPTQLCKNSRSDLANKLRTLRLKHCCERTVFSALHTFALNTTLSGGQQCVKILTDILDLDILATRITCELAEILFRYDCRQIYSLIHQCKDCKEAYRRWVCSTLIPFFAEHSSTTSAKESAQTPTTAATSNSTNKYKNNNKSNNPDQYSLNNNDENFERDKNRRNGASAYDDEDSVESPNLSPLTSSVLSITSMASTIMEQQSQQKIRQQPAHQVTKGAKGDNCERTKSNSKKQTNNIDERGTSTGRQKEDSISTANNEDLCVEGPVISRLLKRTKRKIEFRKRRRIRPCRSVCQTVEQKCPYLLPGDRAPAYPTQYAGEPTFLCLDQNIPETGEQLLKSNHGPPECCYRYCGQPEHGICVYCNAFDGSGTKANATAASSLRLNSTNTTLDDRIQLSLSPQTLQENPEHSGLSSMDKSLNTTIRTNTTTITSVADIAKLPYYAYTGQIYYYDDIIDLPSEPIAECQPVASTTSRCTMPYYPSSSANKLNASSLLSRPCILIWTSIFWYLVNNYILVIVHNINDSKYRFYYYCCYNLNDWWRRLIVLITTVVSL